MEMIFATTSLHIAWTVIVWTIATGAFIVLMLFLLIVTGAIMVTYSKAKQLKKKRR